MISTKLYISGQEVDFFKDENIELNSTVQNIADISKTFSDFSQNFTVPASRNNNNIFQHYYNSDVDGTFNANIRVESSIEIGNLPFRFGVIQLEDVKMKNMQPSSYSLRFFSKVVNLSDRFGDEELTALDLTDYDHETSSDILEATYDTTLSNGDIYYPLISSIRNFEVGTADTNDITTTTGKIRYVDLKPAIRLIRLIEAIETKYNFTFSRDFLGRAAFGNLFMWCHNNETKLTTDFTANTSVFVDLTNQGNLGDWNIDVNTSTNVIDFSAQNTSQPLNLTVKITPLAGNELVPYNFYITNESGVILHSFLNLTGVKSPSISSNNGKFKFKISAIYPFGCSIKLIASKTLYPTGSKSAIQTDTLIIGSVSIAANMPKMKVKDFISSIIKMFNLVLIPNGFGNFTLIPLDDWYANGKGVNITKYVDSKDVTVKRPKLFKKLDFLHQKSEQILNKAFRENNGGLLGYGDLGTTYDIDGTDLKIETGFENLMFERLTDRTTFDTTNIQVGKSINTTLQPYLGKPFIFYRNGYQFYDTPIKTDAGFDLTYTWQTATENDVILDQVRQSVNFSTDPSTFFLTEIYNNLFSNYWQDYISDLYSTKRRLYTYKCKLPIATLININLNDRIVISDKAYVINNMRSNLTTGEVNFELLNYIGNPLSSDVNSLAFTADTIEYSADNDILSADMEYIVTGILSSEPNGIEYTELLATISQQKFDLKITANVEYTVTKVDTGDGTGWVSLENETGLKTGILVIDVEKYTAALADLELVRSMELDIEIGADNFTLVITQQQTT
jgi:hypothetical protein